eukprot:scaffold53479_cov58-Phaeocystis_antarctica.AAC.2
MARPQRTQDLGHVRPEPGVAAGACGSSPNPAAGPACLSTRPARPVHKDFAKKFASRVRSPHPPELRRTSYSSARGSRPRRSRRFSPRGRGPKRSRRS